VFFVKTCGLRRKWLGGARRFQCYTARRKKLPSAAARETGLPVYITECDLDVANDANRAAAMQDQASMFWNNGKIKGIPLWGYVFGRARGHQDPQ
jgi:GH35 family endo-1,4-beta-xylanase